MIISVQRTAFHLHPQTFAFTVTPMSIHPFAFSLRLTLLQTTEPNLFDRKWLSVVDYLHKADIFDTFDHYISLPLPVDNQTDTHTTSANLYYRKQVGFHMYASRNCIYARQVISIFPHHSFTIKIILIELHWLTRASILLSGSCHGRKGITITCLSIMWSSITNCPFRQTFS